MRLFAVILVLLLAPPALIALDDPIRPVAQMPPDTWQPDNPADLELLPENIRALNVSKLGDELEGITRFKNLEYVSVRYNGFKLTDKGLAYIVQCKTIRCLDLYHCGVRTLEGGLLIAQLPKLEELNLDEVNFGGDYFAISARLFEALGGIKTLTRLSLCMTGIPKSESSLEVAKAIGKIKSLRTLVFQPYQFDNANLGELAALSQLAELEFPGLSPDYWAQLAVVERLTALTVLSISYSWQRPEGPPDTAALRPLGVLKNLVALNLRNVYPRVALTEILATLPKLRWLRFDGEFYRSELADYQSLAQLRQLKTLCFDDNTTLTGETLSSFIGKLQLDEFVVQDCNLAPSDVAVVAECKTLVRLEIIQGLKVRKGSQCMDFGKTFERLASLESFRELRLSGLDMLADEDVQGLKHLTRLTHLHITGSPNLTPAATKGLDSLKNLQSLSLARCPFDSSTLKNFGVLNQLQDLDVSGNRISEATIGLLIGLPCLKTVALGETATSIEVLTVLAKNSGRPLLVLLEGSNIPVRALLSLAEENPQMRFVK